MVIQRARPVHSAEEAHLDLWMIGRDAIPDEPIRRRQPIIHVHGDMLALFRVGGEEGEDAGRGVESRGSGADDGELEWAEGGHGGRGGEGGREGMGRGREGRREEWETEDDPSRSLDRPCFGFNSDGG